MTRVALIPTLALRRLRELDYPERNWLLQFVLLGRKADVLGIRVGTLVRLGLARWINREPFALPTVLGNRVVDLWLSIIRRDRGWYLSLWNPNRNPFDE